MKPSSRMGPWSSVEEPQLQETCSLTLFPRVVGEEQAGNAVVVDEVIPPCQDRAGGQTEAPWHTEAGLGSPVAFR